MQINKCLFLFILKLESDLSNAIVFIRLTLIGSISEMEGLKMSFLGFTVEAFRDRIIKD